MKPLINSEGHVRALEDYVKFLKNGPPEQISWTLGQGWNLFLAGHAAMEPTWGDLPTLAQDPKSSKVQGKMGGGPIPGTEQAFNPITGQWKKYVAEPGRQHQWRHLASACCRGCRSTRRRRTISWPSWPTGRTPSSTARHGWTGVQPSMKWEYLPPEGTSTIAEWQKRRLERRRLRAVSERVLREPDTAVAGGISPHPRHGRVLARARRERLRGAGRAEEAEGRAGRDGLFLGGGDPTLRAGQAEGPLRRLVQGVNTPIRGAGAAGRADRAKAPREGCPEGRARPP